jgi:hypothetical protein
LCGNRFDSLCFREEPRKRHTRFLLAVPCFPMLSHVIP